MLQKRTKNKGGVCMRHNLIDFRNKLGLTQHQMGSLFGVSKEHWCNIEHGRLTGKAEVWIELGLRFNLSLKELKKLMEVKK